MRKTIRSLVSRSSAEQPIFSAASSSSFWRAALAASPTAPPAVMVSREPAAPKSAGSVRVSEELMVTFSRGTFRISAAILARARRWPLPNWDTAQCTMT